MDKPPTLQPITPLEVIEKLPFEHDTTKPEIYGLNEDEDEGPVLKKPKLSEHVGKLKIKDRTNIHKSRWKHFY